MGLWLMGYMFRLGSVNLFAQLEALLIYMINYSLFLIYMINYRYC